MVPAIFLTIIDLSIIEDSMPAIRVRQSQEKSTTSSFPRRRESSGS